MKALAWRALAAAILVAASAWASARELSAGERLGDFDAMTRALDAGYAYFERAGADWRRARASWRPRAARAATHAEFIAALEGALAELHDEHVTLSERSEHSRRVVPYETDLRARWRDRTAVIEAVRAFSDADVAGVRPGMIVSAIDGEPVERAVRRRLGPPPHASTALDWALQRSLAGASRSAMSLDVRDGRQSAHLEIQRGDARRSEGPAVIARRMGDKRDLGYIRVRIGASPDRIDAQFGEALESLGDTRALILDLRDSVGPGDRATTIAILSRFADGASTWQLRRTRAGATFADTVAQRGPARRAAPVAVLVDRWTADEGEALAAGMKAVANATIIGTATAGLRGELARATLPRSGIVLRYPAERALLPDRTPRETLRPSVPVDLAAPSGGPGDPILYQALKFFEKPSR